jgi:hypothetical protein
LVVRNPFNPFGAQSPPATVANLERRAAMAERAADQARRDLVAERERKGLQAEEDGREDKKDAMYRRQGALAERERIRLILTSAVAARQPRLAEAYAFESDDSADKAIAFMEEASAKAASSSAKVTADLIVLSGQMRRGEVETNATPAPKVFVKATAESILAAGRRARGQD